jgi:hypothetical protein
MESPDKIGEIVGILVGFLLTLFVYSFVVKDNPMYRLAVHILVGLSAGFAAVVVGRDILLPLAETLIEFEDSLTLFSWIIPVALAVLLLFKLIPRFSWIGNSAMAVLIAIGAAVGLVGAIVGTLIPQITARYENELLTFVVAGLTICVLTYFHFTGRVSSDGQVKLPVWYQYVGQAGRFVITISLAGVFAGLFSTTLVLLSNRLSFYIDKFSTLFSG